MQRRTFIQSAAALGAMDRADLVQARRTDVRFVRHRQHPSPVHRSHESRARVRTGTRSRHRRPAPRPPPSCGRSKRQELRRITV